MNCRSGTVFIKCILQIRHMYGSFLYMPISKYMYNVFSFLWNEHWNQRRIYAGEMSIENRDIYMWRWAKTHFPYYWHFVWENHQLPMICLMQSISLDQWLPIYPRECYSFTVYQNAALSIQMKLFEMSSSPYSHVSRDNWIFHTTWRGHVFTNTCTGSECVQQLTLTLWPLEDVSTIWSLVLKYCFVIGNRFAVKLSLSQYRGISLMVNQHWYGTEPLPGPCPKIPHAMS